MIVQLARRGYASLTLASLKECAKGLPKVTGFEESWRSLSEEQKEALERDHEAWAQGDWRKLSLEQQRIRIDIL